jgi:conjugal transfer mating pair stabilization protein TraG
MKQAMVLNAHRESYDDWREKVGHNRVFPELIRMQATRGMFQQGFGSIVGGEMAESLIPVAAQPVMLAIVMMCFVIVIPLSLLPGGWNYIVTGIKLMIWVCSWPVFYTIIHAIAMIQLKNAISGWGEDGLSLVGQAGFTELILMKYSTVQGLITSVPFISFAIIFGSPYALSSIAGSVAGVSSASSIGANMADGNLSMNQVAYGNVSKYQRQEAPSLVMGGGVIDDGVMRVLADGAGNQIITEHQDQLAVNYNSSETITSSLAQSLANARSKMASISEKESEQTSIVDSQSLDVAKSIAYGTTSSSVLSVTDIESLKSGFGVDDSVSRGDSAADIKSDSNNASGFVGIPGIIGAGVSSSNTQDVRKDMTAQERMAFNKAMENVKQAAKNDSLTSNSSDDTRRNESFSANLSKQEQIVTEKANTQQNIDTLSSQLSYVEQNSGTINSNVNDQVIKAVMQDHSELQSKEQAIRWMNTHRMEVDEIAKPIISNYNLFETDDVQRQVNNINHHVPHDSSVELKTADDLANQHEVNKTMVGQKAVVVDDQGVEKTLEQAVKDGANRADLSYNGGLGNTLNNNLTQEQLETREEIKNSKEEYNKIKSDIKLKKDSTYNSPIIRAVGLAHSYVKDTPNAMYELGSYGIKSFTEDTYVEKISDIISDNKKEGRDE